MSNIARNMRTLVRHPLFIPLYLPGIIFAFSSGLLKPIIPIYAASFGASYLVIGFMLACEPLGTLAADVPAGLLLSRLGDRRAMLLGLAAVIFSGIGLFFADSMWVVMLCLFVSGVGKSLYSVARHLYLVDHVPLTSRGRATALYGGVGRIGNAFGPAVGGFLAAAYGLRMPFLLAGGIGVLIGVIIYFALRGESTTNVKSEGFSLTRSIRANSHTFATAGLGQLFAQMIRAGRDVIIPLYALDVLGLGEESIGVIVSLSWALDLLLFYPAGWIMDRFGRKYAILPSFLVQALGMALMAFSLDYGGLLFASALIGFGNGLGSGTMMTMGSDLAPASSRGEFLGMWRLIGDLGMTSAPLLIGWIASLVMLQAANAALAGAGIGAALIFAFLVPEPLKKNK
jgi:MFS family permease